MSKRDAASKRMVAWALVGVLMVGLWATPGWARKPKEEKLKPTIVLSNYYALAIGEAQGRMR
jgi:hypothetical protein